MIVDSSALIAVLRKEPEGARFLEILVEHPGTSLSVANYIEASIVADRAQDRRAPREFDRIVGDLEIELAPVTVEQARIAREAYRDFGKGSGHPAGLNFGDCFAYALAKDRNEPLLYKGDDFAHTDVRSALS